MVYWSSHPSCDFWENATSSSPVEAEKTRRFLCCEPSSSFWGLSQVERYVPRGEKLISTMLGRDSSWSSCELSAWKMRTPMGMA